MLIAWVFFCWYNKSVNTVGKVIYNQWGDPSSRLKRMGLGSFFVPKNIKKTQQICSKLLQILQNCGIIK